MTVPNWLQGEAALQQMLLRRYVQLATRDGHDADRMDRLKTLLRLLITDEGHHNPGGPAAGLMDEVAGGGDAAAVTAAAARRVDIRRYKTELCRSFAETGQCRYGAKCQFAHGPDELRPLARHPRYRTQLCHSFHVTGFCPYGSRCHFIHGCIGEATAPTAGLVDEGTTSACCVNPSTAVCTQQQQQHSPVSHQKMLEQLLKQSSNDVKQRAICGRQAPAEMCPPAAVLLALDSVPPSAASPRQTNVV